MQVFKKHWSLVNKVKKLTGIIYLILICLIFPLNVFSNEETSVYIEKFKVHSPDKNDEYLSEGINSVLTGLISPINGVKINESYEDEGFIISGSIVIIENSSITSASLKFNKQIIESFNKRSENKSDILNNINEFGLLCKKIIESKSYKTNFEKPQIQVSQQLKPKMDIISATSPIPDEIKSILCFDINNDNKNELALLGENKITISSLENNELSQICSIDIPIELETVSLESVIIKKTQMIIANLFDTRAKKFEAKLYSFDNNLKKLKETKNFPENYFYQSTYLNSDEKTIIAKKGDNFKTKLFREKIYIFNPDDFSFKKLKISKNFEFFPSIVSGSYTDEKSKQWITLNSKGMIELFSEKFESIFETEKIFGGSITYASYETDGRDEIDSRYFFPTRIIQVKIKNGKTMLLTIKNKDGGTRLLQRLRFFKEGSICGLAWDKISLEEFFCSRTFKGFISDFQLCDINNDGKKEIILSNPQRENGFSNNLSTRIIVIPFYSDF
jgi:hypothetical protein